jgi:hypothetical protein
MSFLVKDEKKPRVLPPAGNHIARCVQMIDLGTQEVNYPGSEPYETRKIYVAWELPLKKHEFKKENGPEPFFVGQEFTVSFGSKGKLRGFLEDWRGRQYTDKELKETGVDLSKLVNAPCRLNIIHGLTQKGDPKYVIKGISPLGEDEECPPAHNVRVCLVLTKEEFNLRDWNNTYKWHQETALKSPEGKRLECLGYMDGEARQEELSEFEKERAPRLAEQKAYEEETAAMESRRPAILDKPKYEMEEDDDIPF